MILRRLVEHLSRGRVLRRRLPAAFGGATIYVTPDAALKYWGRDLRQVDPDLLDAASELVFSGARVWDVGANVGLFAFAAAHLAGEGGSVLAIEPDPFLASLLRRSAESQPSNRPGGRAERRAPVEVIEAAVAAAEGEVELHIAERGRAANHIAAVGGSSQAGGVRTSRRVPAVTLDGLLSTHAPPQVLKIDVEGAELLALGGAKKILADWRPRIYCEVTDENSDSVGKLFAAFDYEVFDASAPAAERRPLDAAPWNALALPRLLERSS